MPDRRDDQAVIAGALDRWTNPEHSAADALAALASLSLRLQNAETALRFYADPNTYFAIGFLPDSPTGEFMDDFEAIDGYPYFGAYKPGKRARAALAAPAEREPTQQILGRVHDELVRAVAKFPALNSPHEGKAVIEEELDELWEEIRANAGRGDQAIAEAIQIAAMAVRYVRDLESSPAAEREPESETA